MTTDKAPILYDREKSPASTYSYYTSCMRATSKMIVATVLLSQSKWIHLCFTAVTVKWEELIIWAEHGAVRALARTLVNCQVSCISGKLSYFRCHNLG